jgi:hypothetical protein
MKVNVSIRYSRRDFKLFSLMVPLTKRLGFKQISLQNILDVVDQLSQHILKVFPEDTIT